MSQRSARECEIRWLGDRHPKFNHSPWAASEITAAKALVEGCERSDIDWVSIAEQLGVRVSHNALFPSAQGSEDAEDSDRRHVPCHCTKDACVGYRIRQAIDRGGSHIWYRELVTRYSYLHFLYALSLTTLGSC